ncbi:unnamed protein product [Rotaria sordida]|uniref:Uncharacterized protein n=1 Tax=Rotaria sordida TaxID=392033 RepID=A0A818W3K6_9BILA|nr:unnamed protein product [Rotaria sordida]CAF1278110.1 unnamed protein product [Rotaria sordida]CAF3719332.1 unnamed protein product [Rotaria sordida]CAF3828933.1 unnamed protein product [Rotaria sordida]CAF3897641.1 unnamed protein product [Rotaria sordida]
MTCPYTKHLYSERLSVPALLNHPGRAALVSGPPRQLIIQNIPNGNRLITSSTTTASSPSFTTIEQISHYSSSHNHSGQPSNSGSGISTPSTSRHTSTSDNNEKIRRDSNKSSSSLTTPKSLREWHEQPVNLSEQPPLPERVHVQILSPNSSQTTTRFFVDNDLASLIMPNGESKTEEIVTKNEAINNQMGDNENE